jgi:curved DNA-binding protein CbpA
MAPSPPDPYLTLGVTPAASDEELRSAYRRLVQRHHPDHNHGSRESALRFAEVQEAYAHVKLLRKQASTGAPAGAPSGADPAVEARLAAMERELRAAREQREKAARAAAQEAARAAAKTAAHAGEEDGANASDEDLGYYTTNDSFSKIFDDFADQVSARFTEAHPPQSSQKDGPRSDKSAPRRPRSLTDWIDELGSRLTGEGHRKDDE